MKYAHLFFDLDGTLIDSKVGIINSLKYTIDKLNLKLDANYSHYDFIGPPIQDSFKNMFNLNENETLKAINVYREYYSNKGIYEFTIYQDVENLINILSINNITISIVTSKAEKFAKIIAKKIPFFTKITSITGSKLNGDRSNKSELIKHNIKKLSIVELPSILMIGDRYFDIKGANETNIDSAAILYGYGNYDELAPYSPNYFIKSPLQLIKIVL